MISARMVALRFDTMVSMLRIHELSHRCSIPDVASLESTIFGLSFLFQRSA
jgi:hypothetical protein